MICPEMVPLLKRYLMERDVWMKSRGLKRATALFLNLVGGRDAFFTDKALRGIKRKVEMAAGVRFMIKDLRSTITSITVNLDLNKLNPMSAQLRHESPATTARFYASIQRGLAGKQLREMWSQNSITPKKGVIDGKNDYTGYA